MRRARGSWCLFCPLLMPQALGAQPPLCSRCSFTLDQRREVGESHFWGSAQDAKQPANTQPRSLGHPDHQVAAGAPGLELKKLPHRDFSSTQMRLVHLDLKGAAPKVSYLEQVSCNVSGTAGGRIVSNPHFQAAKTVMVNLWGSAFSHIQKTPNLTGLPCPSPNEG